MIVTREFFSMTEISPVVDAIDSYYLIENIILCSSIVTK